jgi:hypothetical protein
MYTRIFLTHFTWRISTRLTPWINTNHTQILLWLYKINCNFPQNENYENNLCELIYFNASYVKLFSSYKKEGTALNPPKKYSNQIQIQTAYQYMDCLMRWIRFLMTYMVSFSLNRGRGHLFKFFRCSNDFITRKVYFSRLMEFTLAQ